MTTPESVSHRDALDIVFANRNRAYGAYQLRREYPNTLGRALGLTLLLIALLLILPRILKAFAGILPEAPMTEVIACPMIINIEKPVAPPLLEAPPPPKAQIAYTPPVVAPDDDVPVENPTDVETVLEDSRQVGAQTVDGQEDGPPTLDPGLPANGLLETSQPADDEVMEAFSVNKMPVFPGGEADMFKWIYQNIHYPQMAREAGTEGLVVLSFLVGKDGSISEIGVLKTPAGGAILGKEASRVVQLMPKWKPGEANGRPVKVRFTLPIRFALK